MHQFIDVSTRLLTHGHSLPIQPDSPTGGEGLERADEEEKRSWRKLWVTSIKRPHVCIEWFVNNHANKSSLRARASSYTQVDAVAALLLVQLLGRWCYLVC
jgi:hypothetical protein